MKNSSQQHDDLDFLSSNRNAEKHPAQQGKTRPDPAAAQDDLEFLLAIPGEKDHNLAHTDSPVIGTAQSDEGAEEENMAPDSTDLDFTLDNLQQFSTELDDFRDSDSQEQEIRQPPPANAPLNFPTTNVPEQPAIDPAAQEDLLSENLGPLPPQPEEISANLPTDDFLPDSPLPEDADNKFNNQTQDYTTATVHRKPGIFQRFRDWLHGFMGGPTNIGIDTSIAMTKSVSISLLAKKMTLVNYDKVEFGEDTVFDNESESETARLAKICDFLLPKIKPSDWLVGGIAGLEVIYRVLELPKMNKKELGEAVRWAVRKDLPFEIEHAELDYQILGMKKTGAVEKIEVAALVTPQLVVDKSLQLFRNLNATPAKLTATPVAIWSVISRLKSAAEECILVVEIGASRSHMVFINQGRADFHREIPTAGNEMIEAITSTFFYGGGHENVGSEKAVKILNEFGILTAAECGEIDTDITLRDIQINLRPVIDRVLTEIRRSIDYYRSKYKIGQIDRIYLSGGGALIKNLHKYLGSELESEVRILNPFEVAGIQKWEKFPGLRNLAPQFTVATGLAIDNFAGLNLLPAEMKGAHRLRKTKKFINWISSFSLLILVIYASYVTIQKSQFTDNIKLLRQQYQQLQPVRQRYLQLSQRLDSIKNQISAYSLGGTVKSTAAAHLKAISHLITPGIALSSVVIEPEIIVSEGEEAKEVESGNEKVMLSGLAHADQAREGLNLADFLLNLEKSGYFKDIKMMNRTMRDDGTIEFVIQCIY